jgi:hypothetical protein
MFSVNSAFLSWSYRCIENQVLVIENCISWDQHISGRTDAVLGLTMEENHLNRRGTSARSRCQNQQAFERCL